MKEMFSISSAVGVAKTKMTTASSNESKNAEQSSSENFLSVMSSQIQESLAKEESQSSTIKFDEKEVPIKIDLQDNDTKKSVDEHLLDDLLKVVSLLNTTENQNVTFPSFSNKIEKIINNEVALNELKEVSNITDLLKLSKKYDLGLEKISVKTLDVETLQKEFPTLDKKFFEISKEVLKDANQKVNQSTSSLTKDTELKPTVLSITNIDKPINDSKKEPTLLEKIMSGTKEKTEGTETKKDLYVKVSDDAKKEVNIKVTDELKKDLHVKVSDDVKKEVNIKVTDELKKDLHVKVSDDVKKEVNIKVTDELKKDLHVKVSDDVKKEVNIKVTDELKKDLHVNNANELKKSIKVVQEEAPKIIIKEDNKDTKSKSIKDELQVKIDKDISTKAVTRSTEIKVEQNTPNKSIIENLLQGLKPNKEQTTSTITSTLTQDNKKLDTEVSETKIDTTNNKTELKPQIKTEINTLKQPTATKETFTNFAQDFKEKLENYKPPVMRVQLALNPKGLGEVDVTIVNRGNNLHVNITSNTNTMSVFTQNQAEFKNSLVNMGFTNLEMNFSDQRESKEQQNSNSSSSSFNENFEDENTDEETTSIELVIPQYI